MNKVYRWALKYQAAIGMVLALFVFALFSMWTPARAGVIEDHEIQFDAKCIRGAGAAEDWVTNLIEGWDEIPVFIGSNDGGRVIILRNSHNPTWTFLMETPDGTCMITSGDKHFLNDVDGTTRKIPNKKQSNDEKKQDDRV
jgi:hypothetical protein